MTPEMVIALSAGVGTLLATALKEVVNHLVRRAQGGQKSLDDDLGEVLVSLGELRKLADRYWVKSASDLGEDEPVYRSHIMAHCHHINLIIAQMFTGAPKRECDVSFMPVMKAVAGDTFGNADRPATSEKLVLVHQAALTFKRDVIAKRRQKR